RVLPGARLPFDLAGISPDGTTLVAVTSKAIHHYHLETGKPIREIPLPAGVAAHLLLSPDARILASGGENASLRLLDTRTGKQVHELKWEGKDDQPFLAFSPDSRLLAMVSQKAPTQVRFWSVETGKEKPALGEAEGGASVMALA